MTKTVLAMTSLRPGGDAALERYLHVVGPLMDRAGAQMIARHQVGQTIAGSNLPQFVSIMAYPDMAAIQAVFDSPQYLALAQTRHMAFSRYDLCILD